MENNKTFRIIVANKYFRINDISTLLLYYNPIHHLSNRSIKKEEKIWRQRQKIYWYKCGNKDKTFLGDQAVTKKN